MQIWDVFDEYQNIMNEKLQRDVETAMYECRKILENKKLTAFIHQLLLTKVRILAQAHIIRLGR